jgi:Ran GTPase-activating protein (RanGAP) involved in mRNA processing and transport
MCTFFSNGIAAVMGRLQSLSMGSCCIGVLNVAQMAEDPLLCHLDLGSNHIVGHVGGESLFDSLRRCARLETLHLSSNTVGLDGARALAPALRNLRSLQSLEIYECNIEGWGATAILTCLTTTSIGLKSLNLGENDLPVTTLVSLTDYLNGPGRLS